MMVLIAGVATACPPPTDPPLPRVTLTVMAGTDAVVTAPATGAAVVSSGSVTSGDQSGLAITVGGSWLGSPPVPQVAIRVSAEPDAAGGVRALTVRAQGCTTAIGDAGCPSGGEWSSTLIVDLTVALPTAAPPAALVAPNRGWQDNGDGTFTNSTTLEVTTAGTDTTAEAAAVSATVGRLGAVIIGADKDLGIYWVRPPDVAAATTALRATAGVLGVDLLRSTPPQTSLVPSEVSDMTDAQKWTFTQTGLTNAWASLDNPAPVELGVVDYSIYGPHPDLAPNLASYDPASGDAFRSWDLPVGRVRDPNADAHGTHVAGTACAAGNNAGFAVGVDYTCRLRALDLNDTTIYDPNLGKNVGTTTASTVAAIRSWLYNHPGTRVVNMSLTLDGAHQNNGNRLLDGTPFDQRCTSTYDDFWRRGLRMKLFDAFPNVLFVVGAGNCGKAANGSQARDSIRDAIPADLANDPDYPTTNVLAVSATTKAANGTATRTLANYSTIDGEIAAPGGDLTNGVFSSWHGACNPNTRTCDITGEGYRSIAGTSMAAPFVTGLAGLMLSANPNLTAAQLESCLKASAVTEVTNVQGQGATVGLPKEISTQAAIACARTNLESTEWFALSAGYTHPLRGFISIREPLGSFTINYTAGRVLLSGSADGRGYIAVDDALEYTVRRPDGSVASSGLDSGTRPVAPVDISAMLKPGLNTLNFNVRDLYGGAIGTNPLFVTIAT